MEKWIWQNNCSNKDEYVDFLDFFIAEEGMDCFLEVSVSGDYVAYVNGEMVGYGQYRDYPHYKIKDRLCLNGFVKNGENRLCIKAWHTGGLTFTNATENAGLFYSVIVDGKSVCSSGEDTLCRISLDYQSYKRVLITPQLGYAYFYDATKYDGWLTSGQEGFAPAVLVDTGFSSLQYRPNKKIVDGEFVGGEIVQQGVFNFTTGETTAQKMTRASLAYREPDCLITCEKEGFYIKTDEKCDGVYLTFDLMREEVGNLYLDVEADTPTQLYICYGEHLAIGRVQAEMSVRNFAVEYNAREGRQVFYGNFRRFGLRYLTVFALGKGIKINKFGIIPTTYPLEKKPFDTDNIFRKKIYDVSVRTLELCMHEAYEDCPWREQSFYNMDSRNQMLCGYYAFGETLMPKASLELVTHGVREDGLLSIVFPAGSDLPIPSFNLIVFTQFKEYLIYSGDQAFVREKLPFMKTLMNVYISKLNDNFLLEGLDEPCWNFYEWQTSLDGKNKMSGAECPLSAFLSLALGELAYICRSFGENDVADEYLSLREKINKAIKETFFIESDGLFATFTTKEKYSALVQALCVLIGVADDVDTSVIEKVLKEEITENVYECTLSMCIFRYDALLKLNPENADYILNDLDEKYLKMLCGGATTFWETAKGNRDFDGAGSLCHGWSALPVFYYNVLKRQE